MLLIVPAIQSLAGQDLMPYASRDSHGWQNFKWGMSKEATVKLGARLFKDENGIICLGWQMYGNPEENLPYHKGIKNILLEDDWIILKLRPFRSMDQCVMFLFLYFR